MFAALILISLTGIVIFLAFTLLQHVVLRRWHESALTRENSAPLPCLGAGVRLCRRPPLDPRRAEAGLRRADAGTEPDLGPHIDERHLGDAQRRQHHPLVQRPQVTDAEHPAGDLAEADAERCS